MRGRGVRPSTEARNVHDLASCAARDVDSLVLQPRGCGTSLSAKGPSTCARFKKVRFLDTKSRRTVERGTAASIYTELNRVP